jgi:hypothetical protein
MRLILIEFISVIVIIVIVVVLVNQTRFNYFHDANT